MRTIWGGPYLIYKYFISRARDVPTVDICCGSGAGTAAIAHAIDRQVIGVDYSGDALTFATANNRSRNTFFVGADLDTDEGRAVLEEIIRSHSVEQASWVEGFEHISHRSALEVIRLLLESGVSNIFVSTPIEADSTGALGHHINPMKPSTYRDFVDQFAVRLTEYMQPTTWTEILRLIEEGWTVDQLLARYLQREPSGASKYLMHVEDGTVESEPTVVSGQTDDQGTLEHVRSQADDDRRADLRL